jgi:hypothetical protein
LDLVGRDKGFIRSPVSEEFAAEWRCVSETTQSLGAQNRNHAMLRV